MTRTKFRTQLITLLIVQVGFVLICSGFYLQWQLRRQIENELAARLTAAARTAAWLVERVAGKASLVSLVPGDENSRTVRNLNDWLEPLLASSRLSRIFIFDHERYLLFDTSPDYRIGQEYVRLRFDRHEIDQAFQGESVAAKLFVDNEGAPFKAAYAKIGSGAGAKFAIGVEASAESLAAVERTRTVLWTIVVLSLIVTAISGFVFARLITRPLEKLRRAAEAIGTGKPEVELSIRGSEEIAFLGKTMKQMQQAILHREQNLRMMLGGVAHEIRNPLGGIELFAGVLEKEVAPALKPRVKRIRDEVQRLETIIRDFLEYARPAKATKQEIRLPELIAEVQQSVERHHSGIVWQLQLHPASTIEADREQVRRILVNLTENAAEAMQGKGTITITTNITNGGLELSVIDNGPGIAPEIAGQIFEPFFTTRSQGSGLGLALVRLLAEQNDAGITLVQDRQETGAHFKLTFAKRK